MAYILEEEAQSEGRYILEEETQPQTKTKSKAAALENIPAFNRGVNEKGVKFLENAVVGTLETTAGLALGVTGWSGGTLAGLTTYILTGDEKAAHAVMEGTAQEIQGNFQPKTEFGIAASTVIGHAIEGVFGTIKKGTDWAAAELEENPINKFIMDIPEDQLLRLDPITQTSLRGYRHFFGSLDKKTYLLQIAGEVVGGKAIHKTGVKGVEVTKTLPEYLKKLTDRDADPARVITEKTKTAELTEVAGKEKIEQAQKEAPDLIERTEDGRFTLELMREELKGGNAGLLLDEGGSITGRYSSHSPWFRDIAKKHKVGAAETTTIINKVLDGKSLTDRQNKIWYDIEKAAAAERDANPLVREYQKEIGGKLDELPATEREGIFAEITAANSGIRETVFKSGWHPDRVTANLPDIQRVARAVVEGIFKEKGLLKDAVALEDAYKKADNYSTIFVEAYKSEWFAKEKATGKGMVEDGKSFSTEAGQKTLQIKESERAELGPLSEVNLAAQRGSITFGRTAEKPKLHEFPEDIQARWDAAKPKEATMGERIREKVDTFVNRATRTFESLPRTAEFAPLQFELLNLLKYKGIASDRATRILASEVKKMDSQMFDVFEKKVILDDLYFCAEKGMDLPFNFTPDRLGAEKILVDNLATKHPEIMKAVEARKAAWDKIKNDYTQAMEDIGFDVGDRFKNPDYYHHQVLEMSRARELSGSGKKLKTPAGRGFLKRREGSQMDINRDYLQVEHDVMAQMLYDTKVAEVIKFVDAKYNVAEKIKGDYKTNLEALYKKVTGDASLKKLPHNQQTVHGLKKAIYEADNKALEKAGLEDWRGNLSDDYVLWQPREGNVFYTTDSIPSKIAQELAIGAFEEIGITAKDIKQSLSLGGPRKEFVLKKEIAETLDNLTKKPAAESIVSKSSKWMMGQWKEKIALIHPRGFFKYNARNMSGDAEGVFLGNAQSFKKTPQAFKELWNAFYGDGKMTPELNKFFEMGAFESTLQAIEIKSFGDMNVFKHLYDTKKNIKEIPSLLWEKYWKSARMATDFREALLRYANFLEYREQMLKNPDGLPRNYGASIPEEIKALGDVDKRAYWLQNDLLGAYDRVGVIGQYLREHIWPFWSWKEVNARRFIQLFRNAADDGHLVSTVGKKLGAQTPWMAYKIGSLVVKLTGALALLEVYNNTFFADEEKDLPQNVRESTHINFGRDSEGNVIYFDRLGIFKDFLSNFGLENAPSQVSDVLHGKKTIKEMAMEIAKGPVNVFVSGLSPYYKLPAELMTRQKSFPDVFKRGLIRDRGLYVAEQLRLGPEYKAIMGLPSKGYDEALKSLFVYASDPDQSAYFGIMDLKRRYAEKAGKGGEGYFITPRGDALYNYKLAIRYGDADAAEHYFDKYIELGGTFQGFKQSLRAMHPLWGLNDFEKADFIMSLDAEDTDRLYKAIDYYIDNLYEASEYVQGEVPIQQSDAPMF